MQETAHLGAGVKHAVIHIEVKHHGAVQHLLTGNLKGFFVCFLFNEPQKFTAASHIATFAHIDEHGIIIIILCG